MAKFNELSESIINNIEKVIIGKKEHIKIILASILAQGHILLEDVPGVAKTMLARSIAISFGCDFKRVQCTPDLLPTDISGVSVFNQKKSEFEFLKGPVFTNILLADEINRATPRTQSALLEAMEEKQVSVDGSTYHLKKPFVVIATKNPVEQEGTFPLPEAQLDRFLIKMSIGYPEFLQESEMLDRIKSGHPINSLSSVVDENIIIQMQQTIEKVFVHNSVKEYLLRIVHETRSNVKLALGGSPRASIALFRTSQALAAIDGRNYVIPDDIKKIAVPILAHRVILKPEFRLRKETAKTIIDEMISNVKVPTNIGAPKPIDAQNIG